MLRLNTGDTVEVFDSAATVFEATLRIDGSSVGAVLGPACLQTPSQRDLEITLVQAIPKGQKMDFVVEKATELGVARIIPLRSARAIAAAGSTKIERWRRLAKSAAQQCGRADVPVIADEHDWSALFATLHDVDGLLLPWEVAEPRPLRETLPALIAEKKRIAMIVGPEGGFAHDEVERACAAGASIISLGHRIFRSETAGLVLASILLYAAAAI